MRQLLLALCIITILSYAFDQDKKPGVFPPDKPVVVSKEKAPPVLDAQNKADFFKAQSELNQAELMLERSDVYKNQVQKSMNFEKIIDKLNVVCSKDYTVSLTPDGDVTCLPKPKQPAPSSTVVQSPMKK